MIIYKCLNKVNGKCYIGQTIQDLNRRIAVHVCGRDDTPIQRAIRKYGIQSFEWSIIDNGVSRDVLNEKEIYWIRHLNTKVPNGYNITDGGDGHRGPLSEETKRKLRVANIGKHLSEETKKGENNVSKRPEVREKLSMAAKVRWSKKPNP